jgi:hypothetical protein
MLSELKHFYGNKLAASDGDIGVVKDFYFDDKTWAVRYAIADVGNWLWGRLILLSPHAFGKFDREKKVLHLNLSRKKIENSPPIAAHRPVSLQDENDYYDYYEWPPYWEGDELWGMSDYPMVGSGPNPESSAHHGHNQRDDLHLRSAVTVAKYSVHATDGAVGSVKGFLVDEKTWAIRELIVDAGHWYSGKEVLISTRKISRISHGESIVYVNLTKADLRATAENELATAGAGRAEAT